MEEYSIGDLNRYKQEDRFYQILYTLVYIFLSGIWVSAFVSLILSSLYFFFNIFSLPLVISYVRAVSATDIALGHSILIEYTSNLIRSSVQTLGTYMYYRIVSYYLSGVVNPAFSERSSSSSYPQEGSGFEKKNPEKGNDDLEDLDTSHLKEVPRY